MFSNIRNNRIYSENLLGKHESSKGLKYINSNHYYCAKSSSQVLQGVPSALIKVDLFLMADLLVSTYQAEFVLNGPSVGQHFSLRVQFQNISTCGANVEIVVIIRHLGIKEEKKLKISISLGKPMTSRLGTESAVSKEEAKKVFLLTSISAVLKMSHKKGTFQRDKFIHNKEK